MARVGYDVPSDAKLLDAVVVRKNHSACPKPNEAGLPGVHMMRHAKVPGWCKARIGPHKHLHVDSYDGGRCNAEQRMSVAGVSASARGRD